MSGWLDLTQLGLAPNQKHQAFLGAPKIVHRGEPNYFDEKEVSKDLLFLLALIEASGALTCALHRIRLEPSAKGASSPRERAEPTDQNLFS